jgi:hypothetical protein
VAGKRRSNAVQLLYIYLYERVNKIVMDHPHAFLCVMRKNTLKGQYVKKVQMLLAEV